MINSVDLIRSDLPYLEGKGVQEIYPPHSPPYCLPHSVQFTSVAQLCLTLWPYEPQHTRPPCPSPTPGVYPNPCPLSQWCHPAISSSVIPFYSCPQSFLESGSFQMSQLFASGGQSIGVSSWVFQRVWPSWNLPRWLHAKVLNPNKMQVFVLCWWSSG